MRGGAGVVGGWRARYFLDDRGVDASGVHGTDDRHGPLVGKGGIMRLSAIGAARDHDLARMKVGDRFDDLADDLGGPLCQDGLVRLEEHNKITRGVEPSGATGKRQT